MFASDRTLIWLSVWLCCILHLYGQPQVLQQQQQYQQQDAPVRAFNDLQRGPAIIQRTPSQSQTVKQQPQKTEIIWEKIELIELPVIREEQSSQPQSYYQHPTNRLQLETQSQSIRPAGERNTQKLQNQQYRQQQLQPYQQLQYQQQQKQYYPKVQTNQPQLQIQEPQPRIMQQQHQQTLPQAAASNQQLQQQQQLPQQQQQSFPNYKYQPLAEGVAPSDGLGQYANVPSSTAGSASATTTVKPPDAQINPFSPEADFSNDANATMTCATCCDPMESICSSCCDVVPFLSSQTLKTAAG